MATQQTAIFETEGTAALTSRAPRLVLLEGGRSGAAPAPRSVQRREEAASRVYGNGAVSLSALFVVLALVVGLALAAVTLAPGAVRANAARAALGQVQAQTVKVASGQSLWSIASDHGVAGASTQDVVDWIRAQNGLDGSVIEPGQQLIVPQASDL